MSVYTICGAVIVLALANSVPAEADLMCYACNSYMSQCSYEKLATEGSNVFQARCSSKCFTRQGEDDAIYRGCFDAFKAVKQLTDDYIGCRNQTWNNRSRRWCLCDSDLCNRFPINQHQHQQHQQQHRRLLVPGPRPVHHLPRRVPTVAHLLQNSDKKTVEAAGEDKAKQTYRTVWTNWRGVPAAAAGKTEQQTGNEASRRARGGRIVSHSVYPDQWRQQQRSASRRQHAKSSVDEAATRAEPLRASPGLLSAAPAAAATADNSTSARGIVQQQRSAAQRQLHRTPVATAERRMPFDYAVHDFDPAAAVPDDDAAETTSADSGNATAVDLGELEYPYNQEISHQVVWSPLEDYFLASIEPVPSAGETGSGPAAAAAPSVAAAAAKSAAEQLDNIAVDYPYNQMPADDITLQSAERLNSNNGLWKEGPPADDANREPEQVEDLGLVVDYPYNQLFGQDPLVEIPVLAELVEHAAVQQQNQPPLPPPRRLNVSRPSVEHIVHDVSAAVPPPAELPHFDDDDDHDQPTAEPSSHHIYPSHRHRPPLSEDRSATAAAVEPRRRAKDDRPRPRPPRPAPPPPTKVDAPHTASDVSVQKARFQAVPAHFKDHRRSGGRQFDAETIAGAAGGEQGPRRNVGRRRSQLAKQAADAVDYVERYDNIPAPPPSDDFVFIPTVPQIRCVHTGYYQNPKDCTQFVACLFDHNTRTKVLHLMRCPSGLVWDNVHKLCMESSTTCHAALGAAAGDTTPIDSYMQYFANIAAAAAAAADRHAAPQQPPPLAAPSPVGPRLTAPRLKSTPSLHHHDDN